MKANTCPNGHILGEPPNEPLLAANGAFICDVCVSCFYETGALWCNVGQNEQYHYQHQGQRLHDLRDVALASISELERLSSTVKNMTDAQLRDAAERMQWISHNFRALAEELEE